MAAAFVLTLRLISNTHPIVHFFSYEILSDGNKRAVYDAHGIEGLSGPGGGGHGMDAEDIFAQFFGHPMFGFDFGPDARRRKGEDSVIPHEVTLEDLYNGKSVKMNMEKEVVCAVCKGYCTSFATTETAHLTFRSKVWCTWKCQT